MCAVLSAHTKFGLLHCHTRIIHSSFLCEWLLKMEFAQQALPTSDYYLQAKCKEEGSIKKTEIKQKFLEFFEQRQEDKDRTYRIVHVWGRNMFIVNGVSSALVQFFLQFQKQ